MCFASPITTLLPAINHLDSPKKEVAPLRRLSKTEKPVRSIFMEVSPILLIAILLTFIADCETKRLVVVVRVALARHVSAEPGVDPPSVWSWLHVSICDSQHHIVGSRLNCAFCKQLPLIQYGTNTVHKATGLTTEAISIRISTKDKAFQL